MIDYKIQAIPTKWDGRMYRSRLEAKWAAFFDACGWKHEYEPIDFGFWSPDFALMGVDGPIYVEIKPISKFNLEVANKMRIYPGEHLLLGLSPFHGSEGGLSLGWFVASEFDELCPGQVNGDEANLSILPNNSYGINSAIQSFRDVISGFYDGSCYLCDRDMVGRIDRLWALCSNMVQYKHK